MVQTNSGSDQTSFLEHTASKTYDGQTVDHREAISLPTEPEVTLPTPEDVDVLIAEAIQHQKWSNQDGGLVAIGQKTRENPANTLDVKVAERQAEHGHEDPEGVVDEYATKQSIQDEMAREFWAVLYGRMGEQAADLIAQHFDRLAGSRSQTTLELFMGQLELIRGYTSETQREKLWELVKAFYANPTRWQRLRDMAEARRSRPAS